MGRPKTRDVVVEILNERLPSILDAAIARAMGASAPAAPVVARVEAPVVTHRTEALPKAGMRKVSAPVERKVLSGGEKTPEGGYADTFEVVPGNAPGEPRIKGISEEILASNVNIYFWRSTDGVSVKPVPQARELLNTPTQYVNLRGVTVAARFTFTKNGGPARWYGPATILPEYFRAGMVARRSR